MKLVHENHSYPNIGRDSGHVSPSGSNSWEPLEEIMRDFRTTKGNGSPQSAVHQISTKASDTHHMNHRYKRAAPEFEEVQSKRPKILHTPIELEDVSDEGRARNHNSRPDINHDPIPVDNIPQTSCQYKRAGTEPNDGKSKRAKFWHVSIEFEDISDEVEERMARKRERWNRKDAEQHKRKFVQADDQFTLDTGEIGTDRPGHIMTGHAKRQKLDRTSPDQLSRKRAISPE